jgi:hypothetical protein
MALMPWWNIEQSIEEVQRAKDMGLKAIVMCSDPDSIGLADLGEDAWKPFWDACNEALRRRTSRLDSHTDSGWGGPSRTSQSNRPHPRTGRS